MCIRDSLHVDGNKQLLPRRRIDIFKTSFSFSGSLVWNSLAHHLRYPMELLLKTFKRKAFQALAKPPWYFFILLFLSFFLTCQTTWHKMYRILLFSLPCSCKVLYLYFMKNLFFIFVFSWNIYSFSLSSWSSIFIIFILYMYIC